AAAVVAWVDGVFRFEDISLEDLARRLERWYDVPFSFREEGLKRRRFSGGFHRHESLERVSRLIGEVVEARFRVSRDTIVVEAR
ncbi:MAG: DUF4974 domain-containing protein, partial [Odoribacteraceae bacterium]|nr:DUF4974 domain-containing protein [Odoribacteraceae bacterium]